MRLMANRITMLAQYGLQDSEAKVYLSLLEQPTMTAGTLAKTTQVPRSHLYTVLQNLHAVGLVEILVDGKTRAFRARPFGEYLQRRAEELKAQLNGLEADLSATHGLEPPPLESAADAEAGDVRLVLGRRGVAREVDAMLEKATSSIVIASSDHGLERVLRHLFALEATWKAQGPQAARVEVLVTPAARRVGGLERLSHHENVSVQNLDGSRSVIAIVVDERELLLVRPIPDTPDLRGGRDFAIFTTDPVLAKDQADALRQLARSAQSAEL